jgi:hypothetical protein
VDARLTHIQRPRVLEIFLDEFLADFRSGYAILTRFVYYFIVYVSKILDKLHPVAAIFEVTPQRIEHNERPRVADMKKIIHGGTANIYPVFIAAPRFQFFLASR